MERDKSNDLLIPDCPEGDLVKVNTTKNGLRTIQLPGKPCFFWNGTSKVWFLHPSQCGDPGPDSEDLIRKIRKVDKNYNPPCHFTQYTNNYPPIPCNINFDDEGTPYVDSITCLPKWRQVIERAIRKYNEYIRPIYDAEGQQLIGKTLSVYGLISILYDIYGAPYTPFLLDTLTTARIRRFSPLILDLDGDGVEADGVTFFDHEGDGWNELTRWANEDDGLLVWDRNSDGVIDDGSELFGNNTDLTNGNKAEHGFAALAELDSNNDGVVNASDAKWAELRIMRWTDANDDGIIQDNEKSLVTLDSLGITGLNTGFTNSDHVDDEGNEHRQVGSFTQTVEGSEVTRTMTDVWFVSDKSKSIYDDADIPAHSKAIEKLPDFAGTGRVYNFGVLSI